MKTPANYRQSTKASPPQGWLPLPLTTPRALDMSHWLSRAARGYSWNGDATFKRRGLA